MIRECIQCGASFDDGGGPGWTVCPSHRVRLVRRKASVDVMEVGTGDVIDTDLTEKRARAVYADALAD